MWTIENRPRYARDKLRYPSDLTDAEWQLIKPLIPPAKRGGGKRRVVMRAVVNGLMYVLSTGCQWRYIPKDLPPRSTVHGYFCHWSWDGTLERIRDALYIICREQAGRERFRCKVRFPSQFATEKLHDLTVLCVAHPVQKKTL
jgi:transposase